MAKANQKEQQEQATPVPATVAADSMAVAASPAIDYTSGGGAGMEGAGAEAFAIPFLTVLQKNSPQVDEDDSAYVKGAKAGMIFETVSGRLYEGRTGALVVPCAYRRTFLRWGPRSGEGAGFRGEIAPERVAEDRAAGRIVELDGRLYAPLEDGTVNPNKCDRFSETRNHYCLLVDPEEMAFKQVLLSLTSTQIKKSKGLMSMLSSVRVGPPNNRRMPDTFANLVRITTVPESNDKGSWYGVRFALEGLVGDLPDGMGASVYAAGLEFNRSVASGAVSARYEDSGAHPDAAAAAAAGRDGGAEGF